MVTGSLLLIIIAIALILIVVGCSVLKWHPFLVLLLCSLFVGLATGMDTAQLVGALTSGAGAVFAAIGLIIALGTILGEILERTHAAKALAIWMIRISGRKKILTGMSTLGGVAGIPVFCDSGFIILSNLGKSLSKQTGVSFGAISIALATGLYTSHVLIPPTPGPMAAAGNIGAESELGWIILIGLLLAVPAVLVGNFMARKLSRVHTDTDIQEPERENTLIKIPSLWKCLVPLLLPVVLIAMGSVLPLLSLSPDATEKLSFIFNPTIALLLGVIVALLVLPVGKQWNNWIGHALAQAGPIILITTAGGAFGAVLKATPLADYFEQLMIGGSFSALGFFPIVFLLAAGLKTAQGSSTAAMVITSSIIAPVLPALGMDTALLKALLVMVIGGGAMTVSHANDSFFWVIQQYSGLSVRHMYRYFTVTTLFMGLTILAGSMILAVLFI